MVDETEVINIFDYNEAYVQIDCERSIIAEVSEYFTFEAKNARFSPKFKSKVWDGKIRLLDGRNNTIYKGLIPYIEKFCSDRGYLCVKEDVLDDKTSDFDFDELISYISPVFDPYPEQKRAVIHAVENNRALLLSPTSSGKSFIIYLLTRHYLRQDKSIIIIVPSTNLVEQMVSDFKDYQPEFDVDQVTHKVYSGHEKYSNKPIVVTTWQSILNQPKQFFNLYDVVIVDEAHNYRGSEVRKVLQNAEQIKYRFGLTGTLDDVDVHKLIIEGLLGISFQVTTYGEMINLGRSSDLKINSIMLEYSHQDIIKFKQFSKEYNKGKVEKNKYQPEIEFVVSHKKRNQIICKIARDLAQKKENSLILCDRVEHCESLYELLNLMNVKTYKIIGDIKTLDRENIRKSIEYENGAVIVATYGTMSTGVNIKNIQHVMFAFAGKAVVRVLQSIGRGLRLDGKYNLMTVWDFIDDFGWICKNGNKLNNYLLQHGIERIKIYIKNKFNYKIVNIKI